jgi:hypothetical protein
VIDCDSAVRPAVQDKTWQSAEPHERPSCTTHVCQQQRPASDAVIPVASVVDRPGTVMSGNWLSRHRMLLSRPRAALSWQQRCSTGTSAVGREPICMPTKQCRCACTAPPRQHLAPAIMVVWWRSVPWGTVQSKETPKRLARLGP